MRLYPWSLAPRIAPAGQLGVALPISPESFTVFDGQRPGAGLPPQYIPDPSLAGLGLSCEQFNALGTDEARLRLTAYFNDRGGVSVQIDRLDRLIARLKYECAIFALATSLANRAQNAEAQLSELQRQAGRTPASAEVIACRAQVDDLNRQLLARAHAPAVTPLGLVVGAVAGVVGATVFGK